MAIKLVTKKTYCRKCKKLVKGIQQKDDNQLKLICPKCNLLLWTHDGSGWKCIKFPEKS